MQIVSTISAYQKALSIWQQSSQSSKPSIAFVPTMGNLHAGHIRLVEIAKQQATHVVVSIFVNPLQFGANEDLNAYPRTLEADIAALTAAGCDLVFTPTVAEMYPFFDGKSLNQSMMVTPPPMANTLCGASRPGHFDGVATVVMKLFNIVQPNIAVFGKKDFQQLAIIKQMVAQFNMPITIIAGETVREASGLALSSRNGYLNATQKTQAAFLYAQLQSVVKKIQTGERDFENLIATATQQLNNAGWQTDYVAICNAASLAPATINDANLVVLAAAKIGSTRLIDNIDFLR